MSRCSAVTPKTVLLIPNVILVHSNGLYDTYWIQILPWAASVFGIFLLRQTLSALPPEILTPPNWTVPGRFRRS